MQTTAKKSSHPGFRKSGLMLGIALLSGAAHAGELVDMLTVSGFGTIGEVHSSLKTADYVADVFQPNGAGYTRSSALGVDSKVALQIDAKLLDNLSAVVQLVSRNRVNRNYLPSVEWANIKYAITPELSVRLGRTAMPTFMNSETRLVGFANPWLRPPIETYSLRSTTNSDGVDVSYRHAFGSVNNTTQLWYGKTEVASVGSTGVVSNGVRAEKILGIADTVDYGALTMRGAVTAIDFRLNGAGGTFVYAKANVYNLGAMYDPGDWFVMGEWTKTDFGAVQRAQQAKYVTAGYRWKKFTPYATYSKLDVDDNQVKLSVRAQVAKSAGIRWDFMKNTALKVQLDEVQLAAGSNGFFTNAKAGTAGSRAKILGAAVDFVY
ncbi:hypothetical protein [Massilia sp. S19_KUP03_FR1]|uniref:hypothetical protein n=1 Tax=Massilia sp. S19_KUP03_FR1 TaxID=3025503 RepID=UPI002FCDB9E5